MSVSPKKILFEVKCATTFTWLASISSCHILIIPPPQLFNSKLLRASQNPSTAMNTILNSHSAKTWVETPSTQRPIQSGQYFLCSNASSTFCVLII